MKLLNCLVFLAIIISACHDEESLSFQKVGEVEFDPGFIANHLSIGVLEQSDTHPALFYFGDIKTHKQIKLYTMSGELTSIIPLDSAFLHLQSIKHFEVIAPDTILVFGDYDNKVLIMDQKGDIWIVRDLSELVEPYRNARLVYTTSYGGNMYSDGQLFMHVDYGSETVDGEILMPKEYFKYALDYPYFLVINNILDTGRLDYRFGMNGFYKRFMDDSMAMTELFRYTIDNDKRLIFSNFSDSIYLVNEDLNAVEHAFQVKSHYTNIGVRPVKLFEEDYQQYINEIIKYKGYIAKVFYDGLQDLFLVVVAGEYHPDHKEDYKVPYCFYDSKGQKIDEILLSSDKYIPKLIYQYDDQYYILSKTWGDGRFDPGKDKCKFDIYEYR